eukprot:m51a1_g7804 hypothetical protein (639) ;mRNA; r:73623-78177
MSYPFGPGDAMAAGGACPVPYLEMNDAYPFLDGAGSGEIQMDDADDIATPIEMPLPGPAHFPDAQPYALGAAPPPQQIQNISQIPQIPQIPQIRPPESTELQVRRVAGGEADSRRAETAAEVEGMVVRLGECKLQIAAMRVGQAQALGRGDAGAVRALALQQAGIRGDLEAMARAARDLETQQTLAPAEIAKLAVLSQDLFVENEQLRLFAAELAQHCGPQGAPEPGAPVQCMASLVVTQQPGFPGVVNYKRVGDPLQQVAVRVLAGAMQQVQQVSPVEPHMVAEFKARAKAPTESIIAKEGEDIDPETKALRIRLTMKDGSRKAAIAAKFTVCVSCPAGTVVLESQQTHPFVVITNPCQYGVSVGALIKKICFGAGQKDAAWPHLANTLQRQLLGATKQELGRPDRSISARELAYLHARFLGGGPRVGLKAFDAFWLWFGDALQSLRYTRHVCALWQAGLLWGFTGRQDVEAALAGQPPGTFAVRFSERNPGLFAIAYTVDAGSSDTAAAAAGSPRGAAGGSAVRHYLVRPEEITARRTLPDFLGEAPQLSFALRVAFDALGGYEAGAVFKDDALGPYYTKRERINGATDYDAHLARTGFPAALGGGSSGGGSGSGAGVKAECVGTPLQPPMGFSNI